MGLKGIVLLISTIAFSETESHQRNNTISAKNQSDNYVVLYLMEQVFAMKPRIASLEKEINNMELTINRQKNKIKILQNRKEFRCESGMVKHHNFPSPPWPYKLGVTFKTPFQNAPTVTQGLTMLDSSRSTNVRINSIVHKVTNKGFEAYLHTWTDTILYGAFITWMACGY
ncbi:uncharacterized protein LOC144624940 [Crassostrea virginica]